MKEIMQKQARMADRGKRSKLKQIQRFWFDKGETTLDQYDLVEKYFND